MTPSQKIVSVVVPTFGKRPEYLEETLRSVINARGYPDLISLSVIENGGPYDGVTEVLNRLADPHIKRIPYSEILPVGQNWNRCIASANGDWIHILHDDDYVSPDYYAHAIRYLQEESIMPDLLACACAAVNATGAPLGFSFSLPQPTGPFNKTTHSRICGRSLISCAAVLVSTHAYRKFGGFDERLDYAIDWECWARIALLGKAVYVAEENCFYRIHQQSGTSQLAASFHYAQTQNVCIELRDLFVLIYGQYPSSSLFKFPMLHAYPPIKHAISHRNGKLLIKGLTHLCSTISKILLPRMVKEISNRPNK